MPHAVAKTKRSGRRSGAGKKSKEEKEEEKGKGKGGKGKEEREKEEKPDCEQRFFIVVVNKNRTGVENRCSHVPSTINNQSAHFQIYTELYLFERAIVRWNPTCCLDACTARAEQGRGRVDDEYIGCGL